MKILPTFSGFYLASWNVNAAGTKHINGFIKHAIVLSAFHNPSMPALG
jgi:hypothetical protein